MRAYLDARKDWDTERGAIRQKVASDLSSPSYILYEKLRAKMFAGTTYEHDALGTRSSFDKTDAAMLKTFHDAWYAPTMRSWSLSAMSIPEPLCESQRALQFGIPRRKLPARPDFSCKPLRRKHSVLPPTSHEPRKSSRCDMPLNSPTSPRLELLSDILSSQRFDLYGLVAQGRAMSAEFALDPLPKMGMAYAAVSFPANGNSQTIDATIRAISRQGRAKWRAAGTARSRKAAGAHRQAEFQKNSIADLASVSSRSDAVALYGLPSPDADLARMDKVQSPT